MADESAKRRDLRVVAALRVYAGDPAGQLLGVTRNISLGGMFVITEHQAPEGSTLNVAIELPEGNTHLTAIVVHRRQGGIGCRFVALPQHAEDRLMTTIDALLLQDAPLDDRRRLPRTTTRAPIAWHQGESRHTGIVCDLSLHGARLVSDAAAQPDTDLTVYVEDLDDNTDSKSAGCRARVVHRGAAGFGVEFLAPDRRFLAALHSLLRASF